MRNSQEVEDFNLFTSPLSHPAFQKGDSMNLEELKTDLPQPERRTVLIDGLGVVEVKEWPELPPTPREKVWRKEDRND